jgi:hypothetical protein
VWAEVAAQCGDQWGRAIDCLPTVVPNRVAFRDAANARRFAVDDDETIRDVFAALAADLQAKVPSDCCRTAPIPG